MKQLLIPQAKLAVPVRVLTQVWQQARGFAFQREQGAEALLFKWSRPKDPPFWMWGMHFSIDMVWLAEGRIVKVLTELPPPKQWWLTMFWPYTLPRYRAGRKVDAVVELAAGFCRQHDLKPGMFVKLESVCAA